MARQPNLRQIEAFKAVVESGTVGAAAETLGVTQPAISKLIAALEAETGLALFDRVRGRLAPTARGMRLYGEIDRIFIGLGQVRRAIDIIKREERGQLVVGVMPALTGRFVELVTSAFLKARPEVFVSVTARSSQFINEWLVTRQIDVGLVAAGDENPYLAAEPILRLDMAVALPRRHPLAAKKTIDLRDLDGVPQVGFEAKSYTRRKVDAVFREAGLRANVVIEATTASTVGAFVAAGHGPSIVHPWFMDTVTSRIEMRPLRPAIPMEFQIRYVREGRQSELTSMFVARARAVAAEVEAQLVSAGAIRSSR